MSQSQICPICKNQFDTFNHTPLMLPCEHTSCQQCLYDTFRTQKQNVCRVQGCGKISKSHPRKLKENQLLMSQMIREENQLEQVQTAIEVVEGQIKADKRMIGGLEKKYSSLQVMILNLADQFVFEDTLNIIRDLKNQQNQDHQKIEGLEFIQELLQEQPQQNIDFQLEQVIDQEQAEFREHQVREESQRLGLIEQQMKEVLGAAFQKLAQLLRDQVQLVSNIQTQQQQQVFEESKLSIQSQKLNQQFIHRFQSASKLLHIFDISKEFYKRIQIQIEVPYSHRSVQCQDFWCLVGGEIKGKVTGDTWKVDQQGNCIKLPSMQCARDIFGISLAKGIIIVAGGTDGKSVLQAVEMLDMTNPTNWRYVEALPFKIYYQTLVTDRKEENVYSFGGANEMNQVIADILKFELTNEK